MLVLLSEISNLKLDMVPPTTAAAAALAAYLLSGGAGSIRLDGPAAVVAWQAKPESCVADAYFSRVRVDPTGEVACVLEVDAFLCRRNVYFSAIAGR